jgi:hypothetical protein
MSMQESGPCFVGVLPLIYMPPADPVAAIWLLIGMRGRQRQFL